MSTEQKTEARKLQRGEQPTPDELIKIRRQMERNPGQTGEGYKKLIKKQLLIDTTVSTVYNWMKRFGVKTARSQSQNLPAVGVTDQRRLNRLLRQIFVPAADSFGSNIDLDRAGVGEVKFRDGNLRLAWNPEGTEFICWFTETENRFIVEVLERIDRPKKLGLAGEFRLLQVETNNYIPRALAYEFAAHEYGDRVDITRWKMMRESGSGLSRDSKEVEAESLLKIGRRLRGRARKLVSEVRLAAGL